MNAKIKWYQEVLDLEPSSKVFFPLAKLLAENGQSADALSTLRQGLEKNPDHLEAKLLLIELQLAEGGGRAVEAEVGSLADKMAAYPAFWQAWADMLANRDEARDPAFALQFLATYFKGNHISWAEVIEQGLRVVIGNGGAVVPDLADEEPVAAFPDGPEEDDLADVEPLDVTYPDADDVAEQDEDFDFSDAVAEVDDLLADLPDGEEEEVAFAAGFDEEPDDDSGDDEDAPEESFSVRTKTMAVLLEDQGDYKGALGIYEELLADADGAKREDLEGRIEALRARMQGKGDAASGETDVKSHDLSDALKGKTKLMSTLEALAGRLEARAAG